MASVHLRFAKQNYAALKPTQKAGEVFSAVYGCLEKCRQVIYFRQPFGRSVLATTYQMASVHLRFAKQNYAALKPTQKAGKVFSAVYGCLEKCRQVIYFRQLLQGYFFLPYCKVTECK